MTEPSGWLGIVVTIGAYLVGGGVFVGVVRNAMTTLTKSMDRLERRMDAFDGFTDTSQTDRATINERLKHLEAEHADARALRDEVIRQGAESRVQHGQQKAAVESLQRDMHSLQRQLANLAQGRAGSVYEFPNREGDR
jgi:chromosome segregation ATPase